jgi:hypothetical protein
MKEIKNILVLYIIKGVGIIILLLLLWFTINYIKKKVIEEATSTTGIIVIEEAKKIINDEERQAEITINMDSTLYKAGKKFKKFENILKKKRKKLQEGYQDQTTIDSIENN